MGQFFQIADPSQKVSRFLNTALCLLLIASAAAWGQSATAKSLSSIRGVVRDKSGSPVPDAAVQLEGNSQKSRASRTDSSGTYAFLDVLPASAYRLRVEMPASGEARFGPFDLQPGESKQVDLTLRPNSSSTGQPAFYDEPQFTVAGVTDTTSLGGHGSNATSRARSEATKEIVALGNERRPRPETPDGLATRKALEGLLGDKSDTPEHKAKAHHLLAEIEEKSGHPLEAVRHFQAAAELQPSEGNLFDWGAELLLHHAPEPATNVFSKGNRLFPKSMRMLAGLGVSWYVRGSYDKAIATLGEASDLAPGDPVPHVFLGRLRSVDAGQSPLYAEKLGRFAQRVPDNPQANYYYALSLWKQRAAPNSSDNLPLIESLLEKAIRLDPNLAPAHLQLGTLYAEKGDFPSAIAAYLKAAQADTTLEEPHYRLSQVYKRTGQSEKAQAEAQLYNELSKKAADQEDRQRREIQQFVINLSGSSASPQ